MDETVEGGHTICDVRWRQERKRAAGERASHTLRIRHLTYKQLQSITTRQQHSFLESSQVSNTKLLENYFNIFYPLNIE